jgi:CII-binding regulator of phage lambda lysogenization HflD
MAAKMKLDGMPREIADRAKAVFGGVVNDLDRLFRKLGDRLGNGSASQRAELLRLVRALRKSLDTRLGALERLVAGPAPRRSTAAGGKKAPARKATAKAPAKRRR